MIIQYIIIVSATIQQTIDHEYQSFIQNIELFKDQVRVFNSRSMGIGVEITNRSQEALIAIHGEIPELIELKEINGYYSIIEKQSGKILYSFYICKHNIYTPLSSKFVIDKNISSFSDCLFC